MKTTETYISWPCRLKIGAKSKKGKGPNCKILNVLPLLRSCFKNSFFFIDPHVRIVGKADEVAKAKERILASLDSRVSCSGKIF